MKKYLMYIRSLLCLHDFKIEICPFLNKDSKHYIKYVCTKCGRQKIIDPNNLKD